MAKEIILTGRLDTIQIGRHGPWLMHVTTEDGDQHIGQLDCFGKGSLRLWNGQSIAPMEMVHRFIFESKNDVWIKIYQRPEFYNVAVKAEFVCK